MIEEYRRHGKWTRVSRASAFYTLGDLDALFEEYITLVNKYGHTAENAPRDARLIQLRMFFLPDERG